MLLPFAAALALQALTPAPLPLRDADARVEAAAYRIATAARPWCPEQAPAPGWLLHHLAEYPTSLRPDLVAVYALDRGPGVVAVAPDSPAARAGVLPGDTLLRANGVALTGASLPRKQSREPGDQVEDQLESLLAGGPVELELLRGGESLHVSLTAPPACPARVRIADATSENAFADGRHATFSERLVDNTRDDAELAALIAHELAHNILGHYANRSSGADRRPVREQEAEADAFGLRLMAAAGYDPQAMLGFLDRVADWNPIEALGLGSHQVRGKRLAAVRDELARMAAEPDVLRWGAVTMPRPPVQH